MKTRHEHHPGPRRIRFARAGIAAAFTTPFLLGSGGFRSDDLACEQAMVALEDCCASFSARGFDCAFDTGCDGEPFPPVVLPSESECIRSFSCEEILAQQICERVEARQSALDDGDIASSREASREAPVCP